MSKQTSYKNWKLHTDDQVLWLGLDKENKSTNVLTPAVFVELENILSDIANQPALRGVILYSAKDHGFIAGADVEQFTHFKNTEDATKLIQMGQQVLNQLAALSIPTVAMIEGFCLGGGLELALACRYRVVEQSEKTRLGLPEVLIGIFPGWGGSVRLPRLIGAPQAMDMMLSGRAVSAKAAFKMGLVDAAVPKRQLQRAALYYITEQPHPHQPTLWQTLSNQAFIRPLLARYLRAKVAQKVSPEHYPAPYAMMDNWVRYGVTGQQAFAASIKSLANLAMHDTVKNLLRVFFLQERLKGQAKGMALEACHVHVIGAGTMGGDIAAWCALQGLTVTLQDREPKYIAPAMRRAHALFTQKLKIPRKIQEVIDRLIPDVEGIGVTRADVIIEAIYEDLDVKQALFKSLEARARPDAVLATNTSSIPLDEISVVLQDPSRLVGIHFFNPVAKMMLVEVVASDKTNNNVLQKAMAFVRQIDHLPLLVKSSPGFLINRILMTYLMEAMNMLDEGILPIVIDKAAMNFGMPMGPVELADTVGLDVCLSVAQNLSQHYGDGVPERLQALVAKGELGRKTGQGFYLYKKGKPVIGKETAPGAADTRLITDRLIFRMLNESVACLREQVTADGDLLDAGMIFGTGFAPFRGGPIQYARQIGQKACIDQLQQLEQQYGERFKPDAGWGEI